MTEPLEEDTAYLVAVYAEDERGAVSEEALAGIFVSAVNSPPSLPVHLSPADGSDVFGDGAILVWSAAEDPETTEVQYIVEYCLGEMCTRSEPQTETSFSLVGQVEEGQNYTWRIEAIDEDGIIAGPTSTWSFRIFATNQGNTSAGGEETEGCGCSLSSDAGHGSSEFLFWFLALLGGRRWMRSR